jgi:hypothetical protein
MLSWGRPGPVDPPLPRTASCPFLDGLKQKVAPLNCGGRLKSVTSQRSIFLSFVPLCDVILENKNTLPGSYQFRFHWVSSRNLSFLKFPIDSRSSSRLGARAKLPRELESSIHSTTRTLRTLIRTTYLVTRSNVQVENYGRAPNEPDRGSLCDEGHLLTNEPYKGVSTF